MQAASSESETPKALTIVARLVTSGNRRFLSVPSDYHHSLDALHARRFLVRVEPLA